MKKTLCFFIFCWIGIRALTAQSGIIQGNIENAEAGYVRLADWWRLGAIVSVVNLAIWYGVGGVWWKALDLW